MFTKRVLALHDLCSYGRCALSAVVPIISTLGFQVCSMPLSLHSHSPAFAEYESADTSRIMKSFIAKLKESGCSFPVIYIGKLSDDAHFLVALEAIEALSQADTKVIVDPILAPSPYEKASACTAKRLRLMKKLISKATIITPTLAEACVLTGIKADLRKGSVLNEVLVVSQLLKRMGPKDVVITDIPQTKKKSRHFCLQEETAAYYEREVQKIDTAIPGVSDVFSSVIAGATLKGVSIHRATDLATNFIDYAVDYTRSMSGDLREGLLLEPCLRQLLKI